MRPKECIFCGGKPLSREHVWPKWLRPYIALDQKNHTSLSTIIHDDTRREETPRRWGGDPQSRSVRTVCPSCNSGWMSRLQEKAKPSLLPLVTGQPTRLSAQDQRYVAFWCAMFAMNAEFLGSNRTAISAEDRRLLMNGQLPSRTWKIWIGHYQRGDWRGAWAHNMVAIESEEPIETTPDGLPMPNTETTTLVVGQLYAHVFSSPFPAEAAIYPQQTAMAGPSPASTGADAYCS